VNSQSLSFLQNILALCSVIKEPRLNKGRSCTLLLGYVFGAILGDPQQDLTSTVGNRWGWDGSLGVMNMD
jgi:hypothetical protein